MKNWKLILLVKHVGLVLFTFSVTQVDARAITEAAQAGLEQEAYTSPEKVVGELYELVTFPAGQTPDWQQVKSLFIEEAVIVLKTGRDRMSVFTVEGFVQDFVSFIESSGVEETGFEERILRTSVTTYGDIASVLVLYQTRIPGSPRTPRQGIDHFQLIRSDESWKIIAVTNERVVSDRPLPECLRE